jgi:hypothetical protein
MDALQPDPGVEQAVPRKREPEPHVRCTNARNFVGKFADGFQPAVRLCVQAGTHPPS